MDYLIFFVQNLSFLQKLILHLQNLGMKGKILEPFFIVVLQIILKLFLDLFVLFLSILWSKHQSCVHFILITDFLLKFPNSGLPFKNGFIIFFVCYENWTHLCQTFRFKISSNLLLKVCLNLLNFLYVSFFQAFNGIFMRFNQFLYS